MRERPTIKDLRNRYLLYFPLAAMGLLGLLYGAFYLSANRSKVGAEFDSFEAHSSVAESNLRTTVDGVVVAIKQGVEEAAPPHALIVRDELRAVAEESEWFSAVSLFDTFGMEQVVIGPAVAHTDELDSLFQEVLRGKPAISRPFSNESIPGGQGIWVLVPVLDELGQPQQVVVGTVSMERIWAAATPEGGEQEAALALLDAYGRLVAAPGPAQELVQTTDATFAADAAGSTGQKDGYVYLAREMKAGDEVAGPSWTLLMLKPYGPIQKLARRSAVMQSSAAVITLGLICLVGMRVTKRMAVPMEETVQAARRLKRGELDVNVPEDGPHELHEIGSAINHMISEVKYHRHTLSNMVKARTKNLETARKALEKSTEQLRASYDSAREAVLIVDILSGEVLQTNKRMSELFELTDVNLRELTSEDVSGALQGMFREPADFMNRWQHYVDHPDAEGTEDWTLDLPRHRVLSVYTAPVRNEDQTAIIGRLWTFRDITEQRELDVKLRQSQKMDAMGHLAGSLAHDFSNLLTVILGNLSIAKMESENDPEILEHLDAAEDATNQATQLAHQLLGFSDQGGRLQLKPINMNEVINHICEVVSNTADPRVKVVQSLSSSLWDVPADLEQIRQVVLNLCTNAVDAMPNGGSVRIKSENVRVAPGQHEIPTDLAPGEYVRISVADEGEGMTHEVRARIFEPFYTTKSRNGSQGLGLAMAYGAIEKHGGWITCESEPETGSRFCVYLLRTEQRSKPMIVDQKAANSGNDTPCVLVVDDEAGVRRIAVSVLKRCEFQTLEAVDGEVAIDMYRERSSEVDVILLDLSMPKLSGKETFVALKQMNPDVRVLICSGYPISLDEFESETGFRPDGSIQKPFDVTGLGDTVRTVLSGELAETAS